MSHETTKVSLDYTAPDAAFAHLTTATSRVRPYYRSKAFVSHIGVNPLIAATNPIFFLVERIQEGDAIRDPDVLHEDLEHELRAFETQAQTHGYPPNTILAARYIVCLWADEMMLGITCQQDDDRDKQNMPEKSFFSLLDHCLQDVVTHIDLLELFYLCLSLGYEGEYRHAERGNALLSGLKDNLYHRIHHHRHTTLPSPVTALRPTAIMAPQKKKAWRPIAAITLAILMLGVTIIGYVLMDRALTSKLEVIYENFPQKPQAER